MILRVALEEQNLKDVFSKLVLSFLEFVLLSLLEAQITISSSKESTDSSWCDTD